MSFLFSTLKSKLQIIPSGLFVLFYTEMWEVFGRVGITILLVLYLTKMLHFTDAHAFAVFGGFIALVYITPIVGGVICDRFLGNRHSIILGGVIMTLGNLMLIIPHINTVYFGLATVAVGSGFFLPSITPLVGYLYDDKEQGRDAGFTIYYLGKNLGYFLAPILCGIVVKYYSYNDAFLLSSLGMISGIIVFVCGKKHLQGYAKKPQRRTIKTRFFKLSPTVLIYLGTILVILAIKFILFNDLDGYLLLVTSIIALTALFFIGKKRPKIVRRHFIAILIIMLFVVIFSSFLGEGGTILNLFIDRIIDRNILGIIVPTPMFYALDPLFMFMIGPVLAGIWIMMAKRKREPTVISKFALALFVFSLGFGVFILAALQAQTSGHASSLYVVMGYFLFPLAELCIMPIGLSMITKLAPKDLSAMMVGLWLLSLAIAGYLTGQLSKLAKINFSLVTKVDLQHAASIYVGAFSEAALALIAAGILLLILKPYLLKLIK